ncbi:hypothetical protein EOM82_03125 [bacterium]|nr:hypothetical protein [bacterium]
MNIKREKNYVWFGEWPQKIKTGIITAINAVDSEGYFIGNDGLKYAKVVANPFESNYKFNNGEAIISGKIYYFRVEPIKWKILKEGRGKVLLICDSIIINKAYDGIKNGSLIGTSNNYMKCEIREWLNNTFYYKAFNAQERSMILISNVDNSHCYNTKDKVFLTSGGNMIDTTSTGFIGGENEDPIRKRMTSDYSRATGVKINTNNECFGIGLWWLRTPTFGPSDCARLIAYNGDITNSKVYNAYIGVVPALKIQLS